MNTSICRYLSTVGIVTLLGLASLAYANAPTGRYTISNGSVYDNKTKLTWQQAIPSTKYCWDCAKNYCASLGGSAWHLPTMKELQTILDYSHANPAVDPTAFPSTPSDYFWSSTPSAQYASTTTPKAWAVEFTRGVARDFPSALDAGNEAYVRCVH
jgi:hypothetical protein